MKKLVGMIAALFVSLLVAGCGESAPVEGDNVKEVYYINKDETKVEMHECAVQAEDTQGQLEELIEELQTMPAKLEYKAPLQMGFELLSYYVEGEKLYLDVSEAYRSLKPTTEILVRAALVRTFSQVTGIKYITITVEGNQLHDSLGGAVGLMSADQFIDNAGDEINTYEWVRLKLYFASEDGSSLIATNRKMAYSTNISMEKLVMEQLIAGPTSTVADVVYPTVNRDTKVISIVVKDGVCYANFDETFLNQIYNVSSEVAIYSVVNSLTEITGVNKVQISINGETDIMYRETISLNTIFERNLDLVTTVE